MANGDGNNTNGGPDLGSQEKFNDLLNTAKGLMEGLGLKGNDVKKVFDQNLTQPGFSEKFQLAVLNGLNKARFKPLPKLLRSEAPFRVKLRVIP